MRVHLKGLYKTPKRLASGEVKHYYYAWRGGPRINAAPNTPEFIREFSEAHAARKQPDTGKLFSLIAAFRQSAEYHQLSDATKKDYARYLKMLEEEFGTLPIAALADPRVRGEFKEWRDRLAMKPRTADYAWTVLARVLSVAKDRGQISINPCERGGRLYGADRADKVWTEDDLSPEISHE